MRIALITTLQHNPGDDFVRDGITFLLKQHFGDASISFQHIHKHAPITSRYGFGKIRRLKKCDTLDRRLSINFTRDKIVQADLVVQCGAPIYWCHDHVNSHCCDNEWYEPLIQRRFLQNRNARFLNVAGGCCQTYFSDGSEFCPRCLLYIKELFDLSALTTLRDPVALDVLQRAERSAPVLPCTSLFAGDEYHIHAQPGEYVVVNFMKRAGHYAFADNIDTSAWQRVFKSVYEKLTKMHSVVFVCHNQKEIKRAKMIDPNANIFYSKNHVDYLKIYARAAYGVVNRIHAAYALAAFGKPSVVIGNDSRARMIDLIGLDRIYVNDATVELLMDNINQIQNDASTFIEKSQTLKQQTLKKYLAELKAHADDF